MRNRSIGRNQPAIAATAAVALVILLTGAASAAQVLSRHADWTVYLHEDGRSKLCFAVSQPKDSQPAGAKRDPTFFYITSWAAKSAAKSEVSIKLGYQMKKGSEVTVSVDAKQHVLFAEADRAFVADQTAEAALLEALKKGQRLFVQATSERGTTTVDTYSLAGLVPALQATAAACP